MDDIKAPNKDQAPGAPVIGAPSNAPTPTQPETASAVGGVATPPVVAAEDANTPPTTEPNEPTPLIASTSVSGAAAHKAPIGAIVIAVLVAVALAVVAVMTYMNNDKKEAGQANTTSQTAQETVTPSDVDTTNKEIDESLNKADDATDFNDDSLSDTTLNL